MPYGHQLYIVTTPKYNVETLIFCVAETMQINLTLPKGDTCEITHGEFSKVSINPFFYLREVTEILKGSHSCLAMFTLRALVLNSDCLYSCSHCVLM